MWVSKRLACVNSPRTLKRILSLSSLGIQTKKLSMNSLPKLLQRLQPLDKYVSACTESNDTLSGALERKVKNKQTKSKNFQKTKTFLLRFEKGWLVWLQLDVPFSVPELKTIHPLFFFLLKGCLFQHSFPHPTSVHSMTPPSHRECITSLYDSNNIIGEIVSGLLTLRGYIFSNKCLTLV